MTVDKLLAMQLKMALSDDDKKAIELTFNQIYEEELNQAYIRLEKHKYVYQTEEEFNEAVNNFTMTKLDRRFGLILLRAANL